MNNIEVIGNLTKDPELRTTPNGKVVCQLSVAVNRKKQDQSGNKITDFFNLNVWGAGGEACKKYLSKGKKVFASGELQAREWESNGKHGISLDVLVDKFEFLSPADGKTAAADDGFKDITTNDIPF